MPKPCASSSARRRSTKRSCGRRIQKALAPSWFIPDLIPLSGYGADDIDSSSGSLRRAREVGLAIRTAESLSRLAAVLSTPEDFRRTRPLLKSAGRPGEISRPGPSRGGGLRDQSRLCALADRRLRSGQAALRARPDQFGALPRARSSESGDHPGQSRSPAHENRQLRRSGASARPCFGHPGERTWSRTSGHRGYAEQPGRADGAVGNTAEAFAIAARAEALVRDTCVSRRAHCRSGRRWHMPHRSPLRST